MSSPTLPKDPVQDWEQVRDEWVAAVEQLIQDAEAWSQKQDWAVRRDPKTIVEDRIGSYTVPRLLIHAIFGRFLLDPVARFVPGVTGLVDFYVMPSYDAMMIARLPDGWYLFQEDAEGPRLPWNEETFVDTVHRLSERA